MARTLSGSYQPRCAVLDPDEAFLNDTSLPRRAARSNRLVRGGIAVGAAGVVGLLAIVTPGIASSASAANREANAPAAVEDTRPGTTDAFAARGTSTDRSAVREEVEPVSVEAAATVRAQALDEVAEQVAGVQADVAAEARSAALLSTGTAIDAESERLANIKFFWPTEGGITSPWGMRFHPILHYTRMHGGVDIGGATGAPIYAVADGVVTKAALGYNGGSGNNIRINHGMVEGEALETGYLHMLDLEVQVGDKVTKGQRIGTVGNTGLSTAPHLHFSLYVNGANSDPAPYLDQG